MSPQAGTNGPSGDERSDPTGALNYLRSDYVNAALYLSRLGTIISFIAFFFAPIFSHSYPADIGVWYRRALLASAATSALRLHQRMKSLNAGFSRAVLEILVTEDSFHYLLYSIVFAILTPVTVSLVPVFLFALLHVASFTQILLNVSTPRNYAATGDGPNVVVDTTQPSFFRNLIQKSVLKIKANDQNILRIIALNEIMLMIVCIFMAFTGPQSIMLPFIYYPFLKMRYHSRRNPHTRNAFFEIRIALQNLACHSKCPSFISRIIYGFINLVARLGSPGYVRN